MKKTLILLMMLIASNILNAQSWVTIPSGTSETLRAVHFPNSTIGYAVGHNSTMLKSTNGGTTWSALTSPVAGHWFWDVHFTSVDTGFVVGEEDANMNPYGTGIILKTTNGGSTWSIMYTNTSTPMRDLFVLNKDTLFACGGAEGTTCIVIRSIDGGATWTQMGPSYFDAMLGGLIFKDANTGFLGIYESVFGTFNPTTSNWASITNGNTMTTQISSTYNYWNFASDLIGTTGYMMRSNGSDPIFIRKTTNGGTAWTETAINIPFFNAYGMDFVNANTGYIVGDGGVILNTTNGGASWAGQVSGTTNLLHDVFFVNSGLGFAVGQNGQILKTNTCPATYHTINQTTCSSYTLNGQTYTASGQYTQTLLNSQGCDSIITLNLTISAPSVNVTVNSGTLTANTTATTFQWLKCNPFVVIPGATSQTYVPTSNGDYAVEVIQNGCKDTSTCYNVKGVGLNDYTSPTEFNIFPNPSHGKINLQTNLNFNSLQINIYSVSGQLLFQEESKQFTNKEIDLSYYTNGIYFVELTDDQHHKYRIKLIKSE